MGIKRQIALDTETTGKGEDGDLVGDHRVIEIGCVEIIDRKITGRTFQCYLNPERPVDAEATRVHGHTWESLSNCPHFIDVVQPFVDFIRGSELLIHNANFDTSFLDHEFALIGYPERIRDIARVEDTMELARRVYPNHQVNLDALCRAFDIDASERSFHGALLDANLLAQVYLALTSGQGNFNLAVEHNDFSKRWNRPVGARLPIMGVEKERHAEHLYTMIGLAQSKVQKDEHGNSFCLSPWDSSLKFPALQKGEEEGKKDFAKRQSAQQKEETYKHLTREECKALEITLDEHDHAHKVWLSRVLGKHHAAT